MTTEITSYKCVSHYMFDTVGCIGSKHLGNIMKLLIVIACLALANATPFPQRSFETPASSIALPSTADPNYKVPAILDLQRDIDAGGNYQYSFDTENGIHTVEKSVQKSVLDEKNEQHSVPSKEGSYTYTGPDGQQYTVTYIADEFGFRASGAHLPVAPAIPPEIQRSLELLKSLPTTQQTPN